MLALTLSFQSYARMACWYSIKGGGLAGRSEHRPDSGAGLPGLYPNRLFGHLMEHWPRTGLVVGRQGLTAVGSSIILAYLLS